MRESRLRSLRSSWEVLIVSVSYASKQRLSIMASTKLWYLCVVPFVSFSAADNFIRGTFRAVPLTHFLGYPKPKMIVPTHHGTPARQGGALGKDHFLPLCMRCGRMNGAPIVRFPAWASAFLACWPVSTPTKVCNRVSIELRERRERPRLFDGRCLRATPIANEVLGRARVERNRYIRPRPDLHANPGALPLVEAYHRLISYLYRKSVPQGTGRWVSLSYGYPVFSVYKRAHAFSLSFAF